MKKNGDRQGPTLPVFRPPDVAETSFSAILTITEKHTRALAAGKPIPREVAVDLRLWAEEALETLEQMTLKEPHA